MDDEFAHLVPDDDEEIPETYEDTEDVPAESPLDVLRRCQEITDVEPFELLKRDAEKWLEGQQDSQALKQGWLALDQELAARHHYFQEGLRFQEWSEFLIVTGREVFEQFEWIQDQMQRFDLGLEASQELEVAYAIEQIYAALLVLQHAYKTLRELQDNLPAMSESPLVSELIRVGQLAADGKIPVDSFLERLHVYQDMQERLRQALQLAQPAPREEAILDQERIHLEAAFETQQHGVEELLHFAETLDRSALEHGLELLDQGAQVQLRLRQRLHNTITDKDSRSCPFCSANNEEHSRFCSTCSARLLGSTPADTTPAASDGLTSHFQRLASAVQQRLRGQISEAEYQTTLGWFRGLYESVCRQRNAQPPAPANAPPDQKQLLAEAQESMQAGLELIGEGLEQLEAGEQLEDALETVIAGGDRLLELAHSLQER